MNKMNFDPEAESSYPLTTDRMAELQEDIQAPMRWLEQYAGGGDCILSGCESSGAAGFVLVGIDDGAGGTRYEVLEVKPSDGMYLFYLVLHEEEITAENSEGDEVTVRVERYMEWSGDIPLSGVYKTWSGLPRLQAKKVEPDDSQYIQCEGGANWTTSATGIKPRVQRIGGKIHIWGRVSYIPMRGGIRVDENGFHLGDYEASQGSETISVPSGYRPAGDVAVPIRINGSPTIGILTSDGELLLPGEREFGDRLVIDTWYEQ